MKERKRDKEESTEGSNRIGRARTITEEQREKRELEGRREDEPTSQKRR